MKINREMRIIDLTVGELLEVLDHRYSLPSGHLQFMQPTRDEFLKVKGCAGLTGYTEEYIRQLVYMKKIPFIKLNNGALRFIYLEITEWMKSNKRVPVDEAAQNYIDNNPRGKKRRDFKL